MTIVDTSIDSSSDPVDVIEQVASRHDWSFERSADDEIVVIVDVGTFEYHVAFSWMEEIEALHVATAFDLKVDEVKREEIIRLLSLVNEQLWVGHFDLWQGEGIVMYRNALLLTGGAEANFEQVETMIESAVEASEQFRQAFEFVVGGGYGARAALDTALFETVGEA
jgi:hypothetical protein